MLFLPECFGFMGSNSKQTLANAELLPDHPEPLSSDDCVSETTVASSKWYRSLEDTVSASFMDGVVASGDTTSSESSHHPNRIGEETEKEGSLSILQGLRTIAKCSGLWISGGGMHEAGAPPASSPIESDTPNPPRVYNTHVVLDSDGRLCSSYRKIHLFDVSLPLQGVNLCESATTAPGQTLTVCDSPLGRLGLTTCYDLRFPELYAALSKKNANGEGGAEVLLVPSAFTVPTGEAHWHTLLKARAIENQCYLIAAAQCGRHNEKRVSYGHSLAVDPWGEVLVDAGGVDETRLEPKIVCCNVKREKVKEVRERMPIQAHREKSHFAW